MVERVREGRWVIVKGIGESGLGMAAVSASQSESDGAVGSSLPIQALTC
jgi:hypothetical protein